MTSKPLARTVVKTTHFGGLVVLWHYSWGRKPKTLFETIGDGSHGQPGPADEPCADRQ